MYITQYYAFLYYMPLKIS